MSDLVHDSDIGRRRRERAVEALEQTEGVVAATVQLGAGSRVDAARLASAPGLSPDAVRERAIIRLRDMGYEVDHDAVFVAPIGGSSALPSAPETTGAAEPRIDAVVASAPPPPPPPPPPPSPKEPTPAPPAAQAELNLDELDSNGGFVDDKAPPPAWHGRFLVLDGVEVRRSEARVTCVVRLKRLGDSFTGEVQELDTPQGRARAAARAALIAAEKSGEGVGLSLEGVVIQEFFGRQYVMAFVDGVAHRRFASLSGILAVESSLETAAALAILRAVERWVAW